MSEQPRKPEPTTRDFEDAERYVRELIPPKFLGEELRAWVDGAAEDLAHLRAMGLAADQVDREIRRLLALARTHRQHPGGG